MRNLCARARNLGGNSRGGARRGVGLVKNPDGSETGKTKKGDRVYEITIPKGCTGYPVVK